MVILKERTAWQALFRSALKSTFRTMNNRNYQIVVKSRGRSRTLFLSIAPVCHKFYHQNHGYFTSRREDTLGECRNLGQCRNLLVGVPGYRPPEVISNHFCRLVTDSATTFPQSTFEGKTRSRRSFMLGRKQTSRKNIQHAIAHIMKAT